MKEAVEETNFPNRTEKVLSDKWDLNYPNAVTLIPTHYSKHVIKILSTVSNAAMRSSQIKIEKSPESVVSNKSLKTFNSAVSVLWRDLKPD